jgi:hypothetical protein
MKKNLSICINLKIYSEIHLVDTLNNSLFNCSLKRKSNFKLKDLLGVSNSYNPITRIVNVLSLLIVSPVVSNTQFKFFLDVSKTMLDLFLDQHEKDPWKYSSHDFTHSCRTQDIFKSLFDSVKPFRVGLNLFFKKKYFANFSTTEGSSAQRISRFCIEIICLLHDIGYPAQQDLGFQKSNHTIEGMRLIEDSLQGNMKKLFFSLGLSDFQSNFLLTEIKQSVLFHGADKIEDSSSFTHELDCGCGSMWVQKKDVKGLLEMPFFLKRFSLKPSDTAKDVRYADVFELNDNKLGIQFESVDLLFSPLKASIRFCDNLDTTRYRLKPDQLSFAQDALFQIKQKFSGLDSTIILESKENSNNSITSLYDLDCPVADYEIKQLKYFLGLLPIESITFKYLEKIESLVVIFNFNKEYLRLGLITVLDEQKDSVCLVDFYYNRIKDSFSSITFNNNLILFEKKIESN